MWRRYIVDKRGMLLLSFLLLFISSVVAQKRDPYRKKRKNQFDAFTDQPVEGSKKEKKKKKRINKKEEITQTIRGRVVDKETGLPLPGVSISLSSFVGWREVKTTTTDLTGQFELVDVPVGYHSLRVSYGGYKKRSIFDIEVRSGKETIVPIVLDQELKLRGEVFISAFKRWEPRDELAPVSARKFSPVETERYAGSFGDPARLATNLAEVVPLPNNDLSIRGNSPLGISWRLEGMAIPNPYHLSALGGTGGPLPMLNSNQFSLSDMVSGAFPSEFGNAFAGVFDMNMREGNNRKFEYHSQVGFNGCELGAEGPLMKSNGSSIMMNYRYSLFDVLGMGGVNLTGGQYPKSHDVNFKVSLPTEGLGFFTIVGLGGVSQLSLLQDEESGNGNYFAMTPLPNMDTYRSSNMAFLGVTNRFIVSEKAQLYTTLSVGGSFVNSRIDTLREGAVKDTLWGENNLEIKMGASTKYAHRINSANVLKVGLSVDLYQVSYKDSLLNKKANPAADGIYSNQLDAEESGLMVFQAFAEWKHKFTEKLKLNAGVHFQNFSYNSSSAVGPRLTLAYDLHPDHRFSFGYGLHSQIQPLYLYFTKPIGKEPAVEPLPQEKMNCIRSQHYVLNYDWHPANKFHFRTEAYYQKLQNIPVQKEPSGYSLLNYPSSLVPSRIGGLVTGGTGENMGVEATFEKYAHESLYFLFSGSLFEAKYTGSDGVKRNSSFNANYKANALLGYECSLTPHMYLDCNVRSLWSGGMRYEFIDLEASRSAGYTVYDPTKAFDEKGKDYLRIDGRIGLKYYRKETTHELALDVTNISNQKNIYTKYFDPTTNNIEYIYQQGLFPMLHYRINF